MKRTGFRSFQFLAGASFFVVLLMASVLLPIISPNKSTDALVVLREGKKIVAVPPYSPLEFPPLGSDRVGRNLFYLLVAGAKYIIFFALIITVVRLIASFLMGSLYTFIPKWLQTSYKIFVNAASFVPVALFSFFLLGTLDKAVEYKVFPADTYLIYQLIVLALIAAPVLSVFIGEEMKEYMKQEFVVSSRLMGASNFHIWRVHVIPHFLRKSSILFFEQMVQILLLFTHLGVLQLIIGGKVIIDFGSDMPDLKTFSKIHEWSGVIGNHIREIFIAPWIAIAPLLFFAVSIFVMNQMGTALRESLQETQTVKRKAEIKEEPTTEEGDFSFVRR